MLNKKIMIFVLNALITQLAYSATNTAQHNSGNRVAQHNHVDPFSRITAHNASLDLKSHIQHPISIIKVDKVHIIVVDGVNYRVGDKFIGGVISKINLYSFNIKLNDANGTVVEKKINVP